MHALKRRMVLLAVTAFAGLSAHQSLAQGLAGRVSSDYEAAMEGVLVTAKRPGGTIAITVVTDEKGNYAFPADRLAPGTYEIAIRAVGYELPKPATADVPQGSAGKLNIRLQRTGNLEAQLSNGEWLMSMPGADKDKQFLDACAGCHTYQRIVNSTHTAEEFVAIFKRMATYSPGSMPDKPQPLLPGPRGERSTVRESEAPRAAELLTHANLSHGPVRGYALKTYPRPSGRATKVIITQYDLPRRDWEPHDVIVDREGMIWFSDFGDQFIGRMDRKTGKVEAISLPLMKDDGSPKGGLEISQATDGDIWVSGMYQGGVYRWQRATGKVVAYKIPDKWQTPSTQESMVSPQHADVDGFVWTNDQQNHSLLRLDLRTGTYEHMGETKDANGKPIPGYGMPTDLANRPMLLEFSGTRIGWFNPATKLAEVFATPFQGSAPRRGRVDANGRLFFAEYRGNGVGMFDPETRTIKEWRVPTPWSAPYDVVATSDGEVWSGSMLNDMVNRLDTKTGDVVDYLLPRPTNIRRVFVEEANGHKILWVGSNHDASIVVVEPLD